MDSYPEDLLAGVSPLVFAVNAIRPDEKVPGAGSSADVAPDTAGAASSKTDTSNRRKLFDRFLDAISACLIEDHDEVGVGDQSNMANALDRKRVVSLLDESDDDDDLDDFGGAGSGRRVGPMSAGLGFGLLTTTGTGAASGSRGAALSNHSNTTSGSSADLGHDTSFAKVLRQGKGFFQRARIQSVSAKYGFPPSKDPQGRKSLAYAIPEALKAKDSKDRLTQLFQQRPHVLDGILPAGWLEKHAYALPSVILVVCTVSSSQRVQGQQDNLLFETVEHLRYSLVPKRQCRVHVIGLMDDDVSILQGDAWSRAISSHAFDDEVGSPGTGPTNPSLVDAPIRVSLLRASSDLLSTDTGMPTGQALKQLHWLIRDTSLAYYLSQVRRVKEKFSNLKGGDKRQRNRPTPPPQLLPLLIRYCFKIAIYYEFQWKHEKSLRYLVEAYKYVATYYQHLISLQQPSRSHELMEAPSTPARTSHAVSEPDGSVEITINDNYAINWSKIVQPPPDDMLHQCRTMADWFNFKLLSAGFASRTEGGLEAASNQWRRHFRLFCVERRTTLAPAIPNWYEWSYIVRQRLVMSQLVERHPPPALGEKENEYEESLIRCSPWRSYQSTAKAMLQLAVLIEKNSSTDVATLQTTGAALAETIDDDDSVQPRYIGGLGSHGLVTCWRNETRIKYREKALECILHAISLFESELERDKRGFYAEDDFEESSSSRTGARLYYLAGGLLLGMDRHEESASHLTKAAKFARGWRELELAIRRMLIECYEKHLPSPTEGSEGSEAIASMILDSYFNAEMSSRDLRKALGHFASLTSGGEKLKWFHDAADEEDSSLPFSFAVTFPGKTHATGGDVVKAAVLIRSNLDYAVHVNSLILLSLAGDLAIQPNDLLSATNASEGIDGGIVIQAKTSITISTSVELPRDVSSIAFDDSVTGGEQQALAGVGSFARIAKPRSAGITSAGGARLVSEELLKPRNSQSQGWSVRFLGGKPLRCDGIRIVFYPVAVGSAEKVTFIELTIQKKKPRTAANIKRTPFEEENYISSAWSRPQHLPFSKGPRSLRVLGPMPEMMISNLTEDATGGRALEGTVNRIILQLQSGRLERCSNVAISVTCFSVMITPTGSTMRLVPNEEISDENSFDMTYPRFRTPVIVEPSRDPAGSSRTDYGYSLPAGWQVAGSGQGYSGRALSDLAKGETAFLCLDLYRPAAFVQKEASSFSENLSPDELADLSICKTDFYVTVSYRQERPTVQKISRGRRPQRVRRQSSAARPPEEEGSGSMEFTAPNASGNDYEAAKAPGPSDEVSLEYSGSIVWAAPLSASFRPGARFANSLGNHRNGAQNRKSETDESPKLLVSDGQTINAACTLQLHSAMEGLKTEIVSVRFHDNSDLEATLSLTARTGGDLTDPSLICHPEPNDPTRVLTVGTSYTVAYAVQVQVKPQFLRERELVSTLGSIQVDWRPSQMNLPLQLTPALAAAVGNIPAHGPLALAKPAAIRFRGPSCRVECAPFEAHLEEISAALRVAEPFEIQYSVMNRTHLHQTLSIRMIESTAMMTTADSNADPSAGTMATEGLFLMGGLVQGNISLGPMEGQTLSCTMIATRPGYLKLPPLVISSGPFERWIVPNDQSISPFVFP